VPSSDQPTSGLEPKPLVGTGDQCRCHALNLPPPPTHQPLVPFSWDHRSQENGEDG
jgi:hypothetical protein